MEAESFFNRWARKNADAAEEKRAAAEAEATREPEPEEASRPPPTLEDVAQLTHDSDFKPFVARGVDEDVRRSAMKKLFTDPHFNVMDGLDIYIEDYNKFEPIPAEMLAALSHAQALLNPLAQLEKPLMRLMDAIEKEESATALPLSDGTDDTVAATDTADRIDDEANTSLAQQDPPTEEAPKNDDPVQGL